MYVCRYIRDRYTCCVELILLLARNKVLHSTLDDFHVHTVCMCMCTTDEVICDLLQLQQKRKDSGFSIDTV